MTHEIWHVICGTAGEEEGERKIFVYSGTAASIAIAIKPEGLAAYGVPEGKIRRLLRRVDRAYEELVDCFEDLGVPYHYHEPHPENFPDT